TVMQPGWWHTCFGRPACRKKMRQSERESLGCRATSANPGDGSPARSATTGIITSLTPVLLMPSWRSALVACSNLPQLLLLLLLLPLLTLIWRDLGIVKIESKIASRSKNTSKSYRENHWILTRLPTLL